MGEIMSESTGRPITGWHVLIGLVIFFGIVMGVNGVLTYYALKSWSGLEVESSYEAGKVYPDEIAAARQQAQKAWKVEVSARHSADRIATIEISARDSGETPLSGLAFTGRLMRPINSALDHTFTFESAGRGLYTASVEGVDAGQWDLIVEAEDGDKRVFRSRNRVMFAE